LTLVNTKHGSELPKTTHERNLFKEAILSGKRTSDEENFEEAMASIWKACTPTKVPSNVQKILNDPHCDNITAEVMNFGNLFHKYSISLFLLTQVFVHKVIQLLDYRAGYS
jgi:hypothetical protein